MDNKEVTELLRAIVKRLVRVETRLAVLMLTNGAPIGRQQPTQPTKEPV